MQKTNQEEFRIKKVIKRKRNKLYVKREGHDISMHKYFKKIDNTNYISEWKPKGLSDEVIKPPAVPDNNKLYW